MRGLIIGALALGLAGSAQAQTSVDVRVRPERPAVQAKRCGAGDYLLGPLLGVNQRCQERAVAATRAEIGELMAEGHCEEAIQGALRLGDIEFAREVREFCTPAARQVPASPAP